MQKILEFLYIGVVTPFLYLIYALFAILFVFIIGLPFAIGIKFIEMAMNLLFHGGIIYANI